MLEELNLSSEQLEGVKSFVQAEKDNLIKDYEQQLNVLKTKLPKELSDEEKAYNEKIKALEEKEKQLLQKEKDFEIQSVLKEKGLNVELYKFLNFNEVEDINKYVDDFLKLTKSTEEGYKPSNHKSKSTAITKEQFKKMNYVERLNLYNTNPNLYNELSK